MKKPIVIALLLALMALSLTACSDLLSGGKPAATAKPALQTAEPTAEATATAGVQATAEPEVSASPAA